MKYHNLQAACDTWIARWSGPYWGGLLFRTLDVDAARARRAPRNRRYCYDVFCTLGVFVTHATFEVALFGRVFRNFGAQLRSYPNVVGIAFFFQDNSLSGIYPQAIMKLPIGQHFRFFLTAVFPRKETRGSSTLAVVHKEVVDM